MVGDDKFDGKFLRGWRFEFSIDSGGEIGDKSGGVIWIDQLGCVGPGMIGRAL